MLEEIDYEQKCKEELTELDKQDYKISELKREISRLKQERKVVNKKIDQKTENVFLPTFVQEEESTFEDEINYFLVNYRQLSDGFSEEEIKLIFPKRKHPRFKDIILRLSFESIKEIKDINEILRNEELSDDETELCNNIINNEIRKIDYIKSRLIVSDKEEIQDLDEKNNLILVPTSFGNIRLIDELEHIPSEYYDGFKELIKSIEDGTFKNVKTLCSNSELAGISEVKLFKIRVVFTRLNSNSYALISAFMKKSDNDRLYRESLISKVRDFHTIENKLKTNLDNEEFLEENNKNVEQLWNIISSEEQAKKERKEI